jgi:hypothetical protein
MVIRVLDHVKQCSSYEDGDVIFQLLSPMVKAGQSVVLSFEGVDAVPSSFVNAAIVRLTEVVDPDAVRRSLRIVDSTRQINEMIRNRIAFVADRLNRSSTPGPLSGFGNFPVAL